MDKKKKYLAGVVGAVTQLFSHEAGLFTPTVVGGSDPQTTNRLSQKAKRKRAKWRAK